MLSVLASLVIQEIKKFGIDLDEELRKRNGFDMFLHFIPGLFKDEMIDDEAWNDIVERGFAE